VRTVKRRSRSTQRPRNESLPIQALYTVGQLARAMGATHRRMQRLLKIEDVVVYRVGRFLLVPLTELEEKVPPLWESIKASESFRRALDDT
jgi:hypothetical protein